MLIHSLRNNNLKSFFRTVVIMIWIYGNLNQIARDSSTDFMMF